MDGRLINVEREQLDHQKARLEAIIATEAVSPKLSGDIRRLIDDIGLRMWELAQSNPNPPAYANQ